MRQHGFSLVEILIVLAFAAGGIAYLGNSWKAAIHLNKVVSNDADLQLIEEDVRNSILNRPLLDLAGEQNSFLGDCLRNNTRPCRSSQINDLTLYAGRNKPVTGDYYSAGKRCEKSPCPIEVRAWAIPSCGGGATSCEQATFVEVGYKISLRAVNSVLRGDGTRVLSRKNALHVMTIEPPTPDISSACRMTADGRSAFASSLISGAVDQSRCLAPPARQRQAQGVKPGRCKLREVLVGIKPDGSIKCAPY